MSLDQVMRVYQEAIDPTAGEGPGACWWASVQAELEAVIAAPTVAAAAPIIAWWHHDWRNVADTPARAAGRVRRVARKVVHG